MDRLRSPGGCPWDADQTHQSLIKYLLEESYEFVDAVDENDREAMREELGDILLQVYFHSRIAQEHATDPFGIEDVAKGIADKLIRRHPHVFIKPLLCSLLNPLNLAILATLSTGNQLKHLLKAPLHAAPQSLRIHRPTWHFSALVALLRSFLSVLPL